jgi:EmrB/QacA subfamily drug resistance transporter
MPISSDAIAPLTDTPRPTRWILVVIIAASVLSSLDLFIVNLAFSGIRDSFPGATNATISWVLSAYSITFAALLVPAGRLADIYGRKRIFKNGLTLFAVASAACALAPDVFTLIAGRALKGVAAALMIPTSLALLLGAYPKSEHKRMVAVWAASGSVAGAIGPTLGGLLVTLDWRLIFLVNLPVALMALWMSKHLTETSRLDSPLPDVFGSLVFVAAIGTLVAGISYAPEWGWSSATLILALTCASLFMAIFVRRCLKVKSPALDLKVFKIASFRVATLGMACFYIGFSIMLLGSTLYVTQVWHWNPIVAGAAIGPGPGAAFVTALVVSRTNTEPTRLTLFAGVLFLLAGLWWAIGLGPSPNYILGLLPGLVLVGAAAGMGQTGFIAGGASSLPATHYASGTGVINTSRQVGGALGVAIFVSLAGSATTPNHFKTAWMVMAGCGLLTCICALYLPRR